MAWYGIGHERMNIENWIAKIAQIVSQQPVKAGLLTALGTALIVVLIVITKSVAGKAVMSKQKAPFVRLTELLGAIVSVIVFIALIFLNPPMLVWIGIITLYVAAGYTSWRFLKWGEDSD